MLIHPLLILSLIVTVALNWRLRTRRKLILVSFAVYLLVMIVSVIYFIPELVEFEHSTRSSVTPAEWSVRAQRWQRLSWVRGAVCYAAFVPLLIALATPNGVSKER